jgi:hypothetical protein
MRLSPDQYQTLARLRRLPDGRAFIALLEAELEEVRTALRTATGERLGWLQGEAQCLAGWLERVAKAEERSGR